MADIFNNAQLTVSATRATDGSLGLFSNRALEPFPYIANGQSKTVRKSDIWNPFHSSGADRDGKLKDLYLRINTEHGIQDEPLLQRAW